MVKNTPAMPETWGWSLGWEDPLEKEIAAHSSIFARRIPWAEVPSRLQSMGLQTVGHDWATLTIFIWGFILDEKNAQGKMCNKYIVPSYDNWLWKILLEIQQTDSRRKMGIKTTCESCSFVSNSLRPYGDYIVHGILQARILEWVAFPFSRGSSQSRDRTQVSRIAGGFFTSWVTREAQRQHN